jgi:hypothetical protein
VPLKWCACVEWRDEDVKAEAVRRIAYAALNDMNRRIYNSAKTNGRARVPCRIVELGRVLRASHASNPPDEVCFFCLRLLCCDVCFASSSSIFTLCL